VQATNNHWKGAITLIVEEDAAAYQRDAWHPLLFPSITQIEKRIGTPCIAFERRASCSVALRQPISPSHGENRGSSPLGSAIKSTA
jgi:hypothetical protein